MFFHDEEQKGTAYVSRDRESARIKREIRTEVLPATEFYPAEDYHQKYYLRQDPVLGAEFRGMFRSEQEFINSTAAARVNGYLGGYGTLNDLEGEIDQLGLSEGGRKRLLGRVFSLRR